MLHSVAEVRAKIAEGKPLLLAGSEWALCQLQRGNWIGGTIPYFMDVTGGLCSESLVFVDEVPACATGFEIREYTVEQTLASLSKDAPENGYSFLIVPGQSPVHAVYAQAAPSHPDSSLSPVVGWVSGVHISRIEVERPKVFNGGSGEASSDRALVMHIALPADKRAHLDIVNLFRPGPGDTITFPCSGFSAIECAVNGRPWKFPEYILRVRPDPQVPLVGEQSGRLVNVSIQGFDPMTRAIHFYAPVFPGVEYRFAEPVPDYIAAFDSAMSAHSDPAVFSCNCVLNYLYAELEGKRTGTMTGLITFGEIANQLLNQTLVRLLIRDVGHASPRSRRSKKGSSSPHPDPSNRRRLSKNPAPRSKD